MRMGSKFWNKDQDADRPAQEPPAQQAARDRPASEDLAEREPAGGDNQATGTAGGHEKEPGSTDVDIQAPGPSEAGERTPEPAGEPEQAEPAVATTPAAVCPACGAAVDRGAKFCTGCGAPLEKGKSAPGTARDGEAPAAAGGRPEGKRRKVEGVVEPWAQKAGDSVSRMPRGVKIAVPLVILLIIAVCVTLFVLAAVHSPKAAVNRYLGELKVGDYKSAYELVSHPGGKFSSYDYFQKWQNNTTDNIGRIQSFSIKKRKKENTFFGKLIDTTPTTGYPFVVTLKYRDRSIDVNITVEDAGGTWPLKRWRLKLSEGNSRLIVSPLGSKIYMDGTPVGKAKADEELEDALQLKYFPKDIDGAVDYARKLVKTFQFLLSELRRLAGNLEGVMESAQRVVDRFGTSGFTWSDLLDTADTTARQSKEFGQDVARLAIHIYWIFGGGDDGSLRAKLSRVQSGLDVENLPEGWHEVSASLPGAVSESKEFVAPQGAELNLDPTRATERALKNTVNGYYSAVIAAESTLDPAVLRASLAGAALQEETNEVLGLKAKGQTRTLLLTDLEFKDIKLLDESVATVETAETWNYATFQGPAVISTQVGRKVEMVYTVEQQGGGLWKVVERKQT